MTNTPIDVVLQPFSPVTPSQAGVQTVSAEFPCRYAFWEIDLDLGTGAAAITPAMIQEIRLKANGMVIRRIGGTNLAAILTYYKSPLPVQILPLMFRRLGIRGGVQGLTAGKLLSGSAPDVALESILNTGSFNTSGQGISSLICEIDLINTPAGAPRILPSAQVTDPYPGGAGLVYFQDKTTFNAVVGTNTASKSNALLFGDPIHSQLDVIFMFPPAGTLDSLQMFFNNNLVLQRSAALNTDLQKRDNLRDPAALATNAGVQAIALEWSPNGYGDEVLNIASPSTDLRLIFSETNAEALELDQFSLGYPFGMPTAS
jgi:hypothetical protein